MQILDNIINNYTIPRDFEFFFMKKFYVPPALRNKKVSIEIKSPPGLTLDKPAELISDNFDDIIDEVIQDEVKDLTSLTDYTNKQYSHITYEEIRDAIKDRVKFNNEDINFIISNKFIIGELIKEGINLFEDGSIYRVLMRGLNVTCVPHFRCIKLIGFDENKVIKFSANDKRKFHVISYIKTKDEKLKQLIRSIKMSSKNIFGKEN